MNRFSAMIKTLRKHFFLTLDLIFVFKPFFINFKTFMLDTFLYDTDKYILTENLIEKRMLVHSKLVHLDTKK